MPNSEWIPSVDEEVMVKVVACRDGELCCISSRGERGHSPFWIPRSYLRPLPSPTDAAVTEARNRVVEAAVEETAAEDEYMGATSTRALQAADDRRRKVRALLALTARPKPPLEVALEALRGVDGWFCSRWSSPGNLALGQDARTEWERARAALRDIEAAIKGEG